MTTWVGRAHERGLAGLRGFIRPRFGAVILVHIESEKENVDLEKPGRRGWRWRPVRKRVLRTDRDVRDQDRSGVAIPPEGIWPIVQATPREHEIDK